MYLYRYKNRYIHSMISELSLVTQDSCLDHLNRAPGDKNIV